MTGAPVGLLVVVAVLGFALAATLSAGEAAALRAGRGTLADLFARRHRHAERVRAVLERRPRVLAASSFVRLVAEMVATVCLTLAVTASALSWWAVALVASALSAAVALLLVRTSPRSVGRSHPGVVLAAVSGLLLALERVLGGLASREDADPVLGPDEMREIVERATEADVIPHEDRDLVRGVLELGDTLTREVMVPRTDMVTTGADVPARKVSSLLLRSGYSRVPVIGDSVDDLRGVVYLKDVVRRLQDDPAAGDLPASALARPAVFVPESKPVDDLLRELQAGASHLAMVVDEYGGIAGLVTVEDALEEIVGELVDEHDRSGPVVEDLGNGTFRVPARLPRDELGELFGLGVADDDVDTAGGLLAKAIGKVPLEGTIGDIHGLHLVAERTEGRRRRVATLLVSRAVPDEGRSATGEQTTGAGPGAAPTAKDSVR